jgi:hypothetical protein
VAIAAKALLWPHVTCVVLACFGIGAAVFLGPNLLVGHHDPLREVISSVRFWLAAIGFLTGLGSMACRHGESENVALAASTIGALLVFFISALLTL